MSACWFRKERNTNSPTAAGSDSILCALTNFTRLFSDALTVRKGPLRGVLNLWPVDEEIEAETTPSQWEAAQARLGGGMLHAAQAFLSLQSASVSQGARLWLRLRGGQAVYWKVTQPQVACQPAQALVWGLARVISLEHPGRFGAIIDLDFGSISKGIRSSPSGAKSKTSPEKTLWPTGTVDDCCPAWSATPNRNQTH